MAINKPYYRIFRPFFEHKSYPKLYFKDERYASDRTMLCRSYKILENDLKLIFEYIEPCEGNLRAYSFRLYELLLRSCTEFETNCKRILEDNGAKLSDRPKLHDYCKINNATKLAEYKVRLDYWRPNSKTIKPFENWNTNHSLSWYSAYNNAKHDRQNKFDEANLENVINSVAGVLIILYSQFDFLSLTPYQAHEIIFHTENGGGTIAESLFKIEKPEWNVDEKYDFNWEELEQCSDPFEKYNFGQ